MIASEKKMLIVGGGLAGLACAIRLHEAGARRAILSQGRWAYTMRLNFSYSTPEKILEGIDRLGRVLHDQIEAYKVKNL